MKDKLNQYLLLLVFIISTGVFTYLMFNLYDTVESLAITLIEQKEQQTRNKLDKFFEPIINELEVSVERGASGAYQNFKMEDFTLFFHPFLANSKAISSLMLANEYGDELMLLQMDTTYITRRTTKGSEEGMPELIEWKVRGNKFEALENPRYENRKYDPRLRPWFKSVINEGEDINWTDPYMFFTTKEPGITASKKWVDRDGVSRILAFDIKLIDISRYTSQLEIGENGKAFILACDNKVLGLPKDTSANQEQYLKSMVMGTVEEIGNPLLKAATSKWEAGNKSEVPFSFNVNDEEWMGAISKYKLGNQTLYIGVLASKADFLSKIQYSRNVTIASFVIMLFLIFAMTRAYHIKRISTVQLKRKNAEIERQRDIIEQENVIAEERRLMVESTNKDILSSISYAKRLQKAILPPERLIDGICAESFILYKPKDIVAGDFYWAATQGDTTYVAAADCTGHGVPGAILSIVCSGALNRAVKEFDLLDTGSILDKVSEIVLKTFEASSEVVADGMDISLLAINKTSKLVQWSGANSRLWVLKGKEMKELKGNRQPIGLFGERKSFTTCVIAYDPGTVFYLVTDGIIDQFGGPKGKKFKYGNLRKMLKEIQGLPLKEQKDAINKVFEEWKGNLNQIDDVCVVGLKL